MEKQNKNKIKMEKETSSDFEIYELVSKFHGLYSKEYKPLNDSLNKNSMTKYLTEVQKMVRKLETRGQKQ